MAVNGPLTHLPLKDVAQNEIQKFAQIDATVVVRVHDLHQLLALLRTQIATDLGQEFLEFGTGD